MSLPELVLSLSRSADVVARTAESENVAPALASIGMVTETIVPALIRELVPIAKKQRISRRRCALLLAVPESAIADIYAAARR